MKGLNQVPDLINVNEVIYLINDFNSLDWVLIEISAVIDIQLIYVS